MVSIKNLVQFNDILPKENLINHCKLIFFDIVHYQCLTASVSLKYGYKRFLDNKFRKFIDGTKRIAIFFLQESNGKHIGNIRLIDRSTYET